MSLIPPHEQFNCMHFKPLAFQSTSHAVVPPKQKNRIAVFSRPMRFAPLTTSYDVRHFTCIHLRRNHHQLLILHSQFGQSSALCRLFSHWSGWRFLRGHQFLPLIQASRGRSPIPTAQFFRTSGDASRHYTCPCGRKNGVALVFPCSTPLRLSLRRTDDHQLSFPHDLAI